MKERLSVLILILTFLGMRNVVQAQSTANYAFTTNTTGSLALDLNSNPIDMSTGTTQAIAAGLDATSLSVTNIGFEFFFMGTRYTQFSVNEDGQFRFGSSAGTNSYTITGGTTANPKLAAFNADLRTGTTTGKVHYKIFGTAPNRVLVIEFKDMQLFYTSTGTAGTSTFQMRFYESNGTIEYVYGTMSATDITASDRLPSIGFYSNSTAGTFASVSYATQTVATSGSYAANPAVPAVGPINELTSSADGSRRIYRFVPPTVSAPTGLTFTSIGASSMSLNWVEPSPTTGVVKYAIYNSTDGITYNYVNSVNVGTTTYSATGLSLSSNYFWKVYSISEGAISSTALAGSQSTSGPQTYYWTGTGSADWNTGTNWNTNAAGTGTARTVADATDVLIIDGDGTTAGAATTLSLSASQSISQLSITNNTAVTLQSSSTTTRTITITGTTGTDFDLTAGSSLTMSHAANAAAIVFTGTNNTGNIAGTLNLGGGTGNKFTTTGGTGTLVTVQGTGVVNSTAASATPLLVGSASTLNFAAGSSYNVSGYTTTDTYIPTATWSNTSNITLSGGTTGTGVTNSATSLGNVTINTPTLTGNLGLFTSSSVTINGNLNIMASGTGNIRPVSTGTLTVLGNINLSGGTLQLASTGSVKLAGTFNQTGGTLDANGTGNTLEFNGTSAQNVTIGTMGTGTVNVRVNNAAGINLTGTLNINAGGTLTISNGNITGSGSVVYGATSKLAYNSTTGIQTANAIEFPSANGPIGLTINNTATAPNNVVNVPFTRTLGTAGVLALTAGIMNNTGNTIAVTNTATGGVTGGSATAYVKGIITRDLPASLVTGSTYLFPVGKSGYNQMELVNPTTGAGGIVTVSAEVIDAAAGGTGGTGISAINANRYWAISAINGTANFTNSNMRLYDAPGSADAIAGSNTLTGAYGLVGGANPVSTATSITSVTPEFTSFLGYYALGTRAAASFSNLQITPSGNQCTNIARAVTVTVTPATATISSVILNYTVNSVAQTPVTMTNTSGNNWSGTIPTVTPANANVTWSITVTDANTLVKTTTGTPYTDEPNLGRIVTVSALSNSVCNGSAATISANFIKPGIVLTLGAGGSTSTSPAESPFYGGYGGVKTQFLFTAAELTALGVAPGNITAIGIDISSPGSTLSGLGISMGSTALTALTGNIENTPVSVYSTTSFVPASGINTFTFSTPFPWDGTSNVILSFCWSNNNTSNSASTVRTNAAGFTSSNARYVDSRVASDVCGYTGSATPSGWNGASTTSSNRPKFIFTCNAPTTYTSLSWSDGSTVVGTTTPLAVTPSTATSYTATVVSGGCSVVSQPLPITVNPIPSTPSATNSTQCGAGIPTASVASTAGAAGTGTFLWYDAQTAGNLLQGPAFGALSNFYTNDFSSATLTNASITGNAAIASGVLSLTPASLSQTGAFTVNASGVNSNQYQVDFDMILTSTGTDIADGMSYSFSDDGSAISTTPGAEHGTGTKLKVSFDSYDAVNGSNGKGIYIMYNATADGSTVNYTSTTPGVLAYVPNVSWIPTSSTSQQSHVTISINASGQISLSLAGSPIFTNVQLPAAFMNANKASWSHIFKARSGGIAGGFGMDNLAIQANGPTPGYTTYQSSIANPTTFYVSELGTGGCESLRKPVSVTFSNDAITAKAFGSPDPGATCLNNAVPLSVTQTGSNNAYSYTWSALPAAGSGIATTLTGGTQSVTPTTAGTYVYAIAGVDGACQAFDTVTVTVKSLPATPQLTPASASVCGQNSVTISAFAPTNATLGTGVTENTLTTYPAPYSNYWGGNKHQILIRASELSAQGLVAGSSITSISMYISSLGANIAAAPTLSQYCIYMGHTSNNVVTTTYVPNLTPVFPPTTINIAVGQNTQTLATPFVWNGTDNIIIQTAFTNNNAGPLGGATGVIMRNTDMGYACTGWSGSDNIASVTTFLNYVNTTDATGNSILTSRPNIILGANAPSGAKWVTLTGLYKDGAMTQPVTAQDSINTVYAAPSTNTSYTAFGYKNGCASSVESAASVITPSPLLALATNGTTDDNTQGPGVAYSYTDNSCNLIAKVVTAGNSLGTVTANVVIDPSVQTFSGVPYLQRHYTVTPTTNGPATLTLYATQAEFTAYNAIAGSSYPNLPTSGNNSDPNIGNVKITKFSGAPGAAGVLLTPTTVNWNATKSWWEITVSTPSFSSFYIFGGVTGSSTPLDLRLISFTGVNQGKRNRLDWSTAKESIGDKFTVQRSTDGRTFSDIGTVVATGKGIYNFYDETPVAGKNQYRLKLSDNNGGQSISETITLIVRESSDFAIQAYPNPTRDIINVNVTGVQGSNAQLMLTDVSGRIIKQLKVAGNTATIDMHDVVNGIYLLKYSDDSHSETIKMNKQ